MWTAVRLGHEVVAGPERATGHHARPSSAPRTELSDRITLHNA